MKNALLINHLKRLAKSVAILSIAIFQVSFFMKPVIENHADRGIAQEIGDSRTDGGEFPIGQDVPLVRTDKIEDLTVEDENGDMVNNFDLIPENLPTDTSIKAVLTNFDQKTTECLARPEDVESITKYRNNHSKALKYFKANQTIDNKDSVKLALTELADKLVDLGLLKPYRTESSDGETEGLDISSYDLDLDSDVAEPTKSSSIFLDKAVPADLKLIGECHLARINELKTDEEKKAYYDTHVAALYADSLGENLEGSQKDLQTVANGFYTQSSTADQLTQNQYGLHYSAQTHGQSSLIANAKINEIKALQARLAANPSDTTLTTQIQTAQSQLVTELQNINTKAKADAASALATNPEGLKIAQLSIDTASEYWAQESYKALSGQPTTAFSAFSPTTPISAANPAILGQQSALFPNSALAANPGIANLDPENAMTWTPPGTPESLIAVDPGQTVRRNDFALRPQGIDRSVQPIARPAVGN